MTVTWDAGTGGEGSGQWEAWRAASESLWIEVDILNLYLNYYIYHKLQLCYPTSPYMSIFINIFD